MYSGIPDVRLDKSMVGKHIYLATHTSTSSDRLVAEGFAGDDGMVIEFEARGGKRLDKYFADVKWM